MYTVSTVSILYTVYCINTVFVNSTNKITNIETAVLSNILVLKVSGKEVQAAHSLSKAAK